MPTALEIIQQCKARGIDFNKILKSAHCDEHVSAVGKKSEIPNVHSATPLMPTDIKQDEADAPPDPNRPGPKQGKEPTGAIPGDKEDHGEPEGKEYKGEPETKEAFVQKAKTLTAALFTLKQAGLMRPDLLKLAADALEVTPVYMDINTTEGVIAAGHAEDSPVVAEKIKQASEAINEKVLNRVVEKLAAYYFEG